MGAIGDGWRGPRIIHAVQQANLAMENGMFGVAAKQLDKAERMLIKTNMHRDSLISLIFLYGCMEGAAGHAGAEDLSKHCKCMQALCKARLDAGHYYNY